MIKAQKKGFATTGKCLERDFAPGSSAWEADMLLLHYGCKCYSSAYGLLFEGEKSTVNKLWNHFVCLVSFNPFVSPPADCNVCISKSTPNCHKVVIGCRTRGATRIESTQRSIDTSRGKAVSGFQSHSRYRHRQYDRCMQTNDNVARTNAPARAAWLPQ